MDRFDLNEYGSLLGVKSVYKVFYSIFVLTIGLKAVAMIFLIVTGHDGSVKFINSLFYPLSNNVFEESLN